MFKELTSPQLPYISTPLQTSSDSIDQVAKKFYTSARKALSAI